MDTRRDVIKKMVYAAPLMTTITVTPSFASCGSPWGPPLEGPVYDLPEGVEPLVCPDTTIVPS